MKRSKLKIFGLVLAGVIAICSFTACSNNVSDEVTTTESVVTDVFVNETAVHTEAETENIVTTQASAINLKVDNDDLSFLKEIAWDIIETPYLVEYYNVSSENAFETAMDRMVNPGGNGFYATVADYYGIDTMTEYFNIYDGKTGKDPLGKMKESYVKIAAEPFEWILINLLGVAPDREKTSEEDDNTYYYYEGYYYYSARESGGGDTFRLREYKEQPDGSYLIYFNASYDTDTYPEGDYATFEMKAELKAVDDKEVWNIHHFIRLEK